MRQVMVAAALVGAVCIPAPARASSDNRSTAWAYYLLYAGEGLGLGGSMVTGIGCGVSLGLRDRPSRGWMVASYVFGGVNVVLGAVNFGISDGHTFNLAAGAVHLGASAINITLSSLALVKRRRHAPPPEAPPPVRIAVAPLLAPASGDSAMLGIGLQVLGW